MPPLDPSAQSSTPRSLGTVRARAGLKEWAITGEALARGRQIVLLRKGGLLDEDGAFHLEHREFFLLPSWFHAEHSLVRTEHRDLWDLASREADESAKVAYLRLHARVEAVWRLTEDAQSALERARHIWAPSYLDLRFGYQAHKPLLCAALRVSILERPIRYELRQADLGCRSWVEWEDELACSARPALSEAAWTKAMRELETALHERGASVPDRPETTESMG